MYKNYKRGVVIMKRKVIQIANSTQLISLPRKWSQKYGVKKGDEINNFDGVDYFMLDAFIIIRSEGDFAAIVT